MDTGKFEGGTPARTTFHPSPDFTNFGRLYLDQGAHEPSLAESTAPFHHDPSQRIVVLCPRSYSHCLVLRVRTLLKFLGSHEGSEVEWDEWKSHVVIPSTDLDIQQSIRILVSGCRLFSLHSMGSGAQMEVHDFSMRGRANCLRQADRGFAGLKCLLSTGVRARIRTEILYAHSGHDSIVFSEVSPLVPFRFQ